MECYTLQLFPFISNLLGVKHQQVANFIRFAYLATIAKLKFKFLSIEPITVEKLEEIVSENSYKFEFEGDLQSCALVSLNTLVALSASNKSWLKIKEPNFKSKKKLEWKALMPPVEVKDDSKSYSIQCLCVSNVPKDFVLYVTDVKLFNILNSWRPDELLCDLVTKMTVECSVENKVPSIAKTAVVSVINTGDDVGGSVLEDILDDYFESPRILKVGEVIRVNLLSSNDYLRSRVSLCKLSDIYFKVVSIEGKSTKEPYYILKTHTELYLNPFVHSYLPPQNVQYIRTSNYIPGYELPNCPDGLINYYNKLSKIFNLLSRDNNIEGSILLSGVRGSGKKIVLKTVSKAFGFNIIEVNCFDVYGSNASLTAGKFDQICARARISVPCVLYLKNVELLGREENYNENIRLIDIFETCIKEIHKRKPNSYPLIIVGSTELKITDLVPGIARLFIHVISFETPKPEECYLNLKWLVKKSNLICMSDVLQKVAEQVRGYVFDDLVLLVQHAIRFLSQELSRNLQLKHFTQGIGIMEAAYSDSIGAAKVPEVHWDDIGGLNDLKEEIMLTLNLPIQQPELFASGLKRSGILFYGPPGTGKTLMAKAVATECNYNFLSVKGPELMNKYVGQSEKNVREVFERAREASPCVIFFDELDSLAPSRGRSGDSGGVADRVVSQLLAEMDGLDKNKDVFVIAATNRPDLIDSALLRPGRFDKMFYVGVCGDSNSKLSVLKALTKRFNLGNDIDFEKIIKSLPTQVTGADLYSICSNAWFAAARRAVHLIDNGTQVTLPLEVSSDDFSEAMTQFVPSLTPQDLEYYDNLKRTQD